MKKIMLLLIAVMIGSMTFAQDQKMVQLKPAQLPKGVTDYISKNLPGATIVKAGKIEDKSGLTYVTMVEIKGRKHAYQFDKDGKFVGKADHLFKAKSTGAPVQSAVKPNTDPAQGNPPAAKPPVKPKEN